MEKLTLDKNCPFTNQPCNTDCALIVVHGHENYYSNKYEYTYTCGLMAKSTQFTADMEMIKQDGGVNGF